MCRFWIFCLFVCCCVGVGMKWCDVFVCVDLCCLVVLFWFYIGWMVGGSLFVFVVLFVNVGLLVVLGYFIVLMVLVGMVGVVFNFFMLVVLICVFVFVCIGG